MTDEPAAGVVVGRGAKPTAMQPREQQLGLALAGAAGVAGVVAGALSSDVLLSAMGVAAALALALAVRHGQRVITAIAALLAGIVVLYLPLELAFVGYSGWLMLRTSRAQGKVNAARPARTGPRRRQAGAARSAKAAKAVPVAEAIAASARQPTANRRYTPPKAKPGRRR